MSDWSASHTAARDGSTPLLQINPSLPIDQVEANRPRRRFSSQVWALIRHVLTPAPHPTHPSSTRIPGLIVLPVPRSRIPATGYAQ